MAWLDDSEITLTVLPSRSASSVMPEDGSVSSELVSGELAQPSAITTRSRPCWMASMTPK